MINDTIIVDYDPFAMESRVSVCKEGKRAQYSVASSLEELVDSLGKLADEHNVYSVKANAPYATIGEIARQASAIYTKNKLNIEGF